MKSKIFNITELKNVVVRLHDESKVVASTSGCFDILHAGHVRYLEEAREKGDVLIVMLNSDQSVRGLKGSTRPIVPQNERAEVIAGLGCVDYVVIFDESTPCDVLSQIKPDIFVKGGDYSGVHIPEEDVLGAYGGRVEYVCLVEGCSSTNIIEKIKETK